MSGIYLWDGTGAAKASGEKVAAPAGVWMRSIRAWWRRRRGLGLLAFGAAAALGLHFWAAPAFAASAKDCLVTEETDADDALTYRNDCNRTVIFYYCVVDPQRSEVAPCKRIIFGTRRVPMHGSRGQLFLTQEMDPNSSYDIKLWGGSRIKWAACDAELGGLESFTPKGNAALDFSYECSE
jgi:hypothetical protein